MMKAESNAKYANLHLHSNASDGGFRPAHLVRLGKSLGYKALALTDHETIYGLPEFFEEAEKEGIEVMTGCEFYGVVDGAVYHLVGLDFDPKHPSIVALCKTLTSYRNENTKAKFDLVHDNGFFPEVTWEDVVACNPRTDWYGPDQIGNAFDLKGVATYCSAIHEFRKAFNSFGVKYSTKKLQALGVIQAIREAGGVAIFAHPPKEAFSKGHVKMLVDAGLNGIEVSHPNFDAENSQLALAAAEEFNLYRSGGTDHTGPMSGCDGSHAIPVWHGITYDEYVTIKERRLD